MLQQRSLRAGGACSERGVSNCSVQAPRINASMLQRQPFKVQCYSNVVPLRIEDRSAHMGLASANRGSLQQNRCTSPPCLLFKLTGWIAPCCTPLPNHLIPLATIAKDVLSPFGNSHCTVVSNDLYCPALAPVLGYKRQYSVSPEYQ